ncbi:hypothetical protein A2584_05150 [Candidatus Beckwithbacteria bacterium RIFOXYD1_FULL_50_11]|nr:MAG: hypothetical protein A2584_05150 [Candidatus Beckwithbacteria bacterium RIFOXYD1_FULL_50_11]
MTGRKVIAGQPVAVGISANAIGSGVEFLVKDLLPGSVGRKGDFGFNRVDAAICQLVGEGKVEVLAFAEGGADAAYL